VFSIDAHLIKGKVDTRGQAIELHNTHVEVNNGQYTVAVDNAGQFSVEVSDAGTYKLDVMNINYYFEPIVVEVYEEEYASSKNVKAFLYNLKSGKDMNVRLAYPLHLEPSTRNGYFEEEIPFNIMKYASSPFVLMGGVMVLMKFMTSAIDPEELK